MKARSFLSWILLLGLHSNPSFGEEDHPVKLKPLRTMGSVHLKHDQGVLALACSPKGDYLASCGDDDIIRLWDTKTFQLVWEVESKIFNLDRLVFSPDGQYLAIPNSNRFLATPNSNRLLRLIEVSSGKEIPFFDKSVWHAIFAVAFSPDGKWIAFGERVQQENQEDWQVSVWDFKERKEIFTFTDLQSEIEFCNLSFSPDGNYLAAGCTDRKVLVWNLQTRKKEYEVAHGKPVLTAEFSRNFLATLDEDGVYLHDRKSGKVIHTIESPKRQDYQCVQFSPDETLLATGNSRSGDIVLWNMETGKRVQTLQGHVSSFSQACKALCFSPDGKRLYSGGGDGMIRVWDLKSGKELFPQEDHAGPVYACTFSPDGSFFLSGGFDRILRKWDTQTGKLLERFPLGYSDPLKITMISTTNEFHAVGTTVCYAETFSGAIHLCDPKTKQVKLLSPKETTAIHSFQFREDGKNRSLFAVLSNGDLVSWSPDFSSSPKVIGSPTRDCFPHYVHWGREVSFLYWDWEKSDLIWVNYRNPKNPIRSPFPLNASSFFLSPNERYLLTGGKGGGLALWTTNPPQTKKRWSTDLRVWDRTQFSPDSRFFAASYDDNQVSIFETASQNHLFDLDGHRAEVTSLAFSPDNRFVLTASEDSRLMLWDLRSFPESKDKPIFVSEKELSQWWEDLGIGNAPVALKAVLRFVQSPAKSIEYLKMRLKSIEPLSDEKINQWIRELDHKRFAVRKKAFQELDESSELVEERLEKELKNSPSSEVQNAITQLLENRKKPRSYPNRNALRQIRAVQALEYIGNEEAKELLKGSFNPRSQRGVGAIAIGVGPASRAGPSVKVSESFKQYPETAFWGYIFALFPHPALVSLGSRHLLCNQTNRFRIGNTLFGKYASS